MPYFTPAGSQMAAPDADGFIRRWMLEPIVKPNRTKTVFTGSHVREALNTQYFPDQFTVLPYKGDKVTVAGHYLAWHALDSNNFDVRLFRFAYGLNKTTYGVIFWAATVVNSPRDMKHARLAVGSNAASMSWPTAATLWAYWRQHSALIKFDPTSDRAKWSFRRP